MKPSYACVYSLLAFRSEHLITPQRQNNDCGKRQPANNQMRNGQRDHRFERLRIAGCAQPRNIRSNAQAELNHQQAKGDFPRPSQIVVVPVAATS